MKTLFAHVDILLKNNGIYETLHDAYLGVDNDLISYIGKELPKGKFDVIKELKDHLLIPGLVNAHGHSAMTILRGVGSGKKLQDWLNESIFPIEAKLTPKDVEVGTQLAMCEMLASGTTTFANMYDFPYSSALVTAKAKMRSNICRTGLCFEPVEMKDCVRFHECLNVAKNLSGELKPDDELERELGVKTFPICIENAVKSQLIQGVLSFHSEYLTTPKFVSETVKENRLLKLPIEFHACETKKEVDECIQKYGVSPIQYFYDLGVLEGGYAYAAHCVHVTDADLKILAKTGTSMVTNPSSNMKLASGFAPIRKALDLGVNVALGTDGCASNNNLDMFEEMHVLALIQAGYNKNPGELRVSEIFDMATVNGAKAMHFKNLGELKVGYKADIVAIDLSKPHLKPNLDTLSLLVYSAHGSDVDLTMVSGEILYENGKFLTIDYDRVLKETEEIVNRLYK